MILERIEHETGAPMQDLLQIVATASYRYKTYRIAKRTGGYRVIDHPSTDLKFLQRWLNRNLFTLLPVHEVAFGYRHGVGIADNARIHVKNNYLLKVDFAEFFPSLRHNDVKALLGAHFAEPIGALSKSDIDIIAKIVCKDGALTIGAPSSPLLSNAILYDFDCFVLEVCKNREVTYSRYADDLFMSTNQSNQLPEVLRAIRVDLRARAWPRLTINEGKTVSTSKKRRRVVAGVVLTPDGSLSVGRGKKRQIRALIHRYTANELQVEEMSYLSGYLAFVISIEPHFVDRVRKKYGNEAIDQLMGMSPATRKTYGRRKV